MTPTTPSVPLTISPEARALAAELGFQSQLDQMIERALQTFPNLLRVEVVRSDIADEPISFIVTKVSIAGQPDFETDYRVRRRQWCEWVWANYPPNVYTTIILDLIYSETYRAR